MAEYTAKTRTNYFAVKDAAKFEGFMARFAGNAGTYPYFGKNSEGKYAFYFGNSLSNAVALYDEDCMEEPVYQVDDFISELQEHIADGDACVITEVGSERMRYLSGLATIVTSDECKDISLTDIGVVMARDMLGNPDWITQMDY